MDRDYEQTYEDDSITDPDERTRIFGQYDHRRIYGADYADRLRQAGFQVADIDYAATFTEAERRLYALPADHMYVVLQSLTGGRRNGCQTGNRPTAIRGLVLPWKSLPQVMEAPLERASEVK